MLSPVFPALSEHEQVTEDLRRMLAAEKKPLTEKAESLEIEIDWAELLTAEAADNLKHSIDPEPTEMTKNENEFYKKWMTALEHEQAKRDELDELKDKISKLKTLPELMQQALDSMTELQALARSHYYSDEVQRSPVVAQAQYEIDLAQAVIRRETRRLNDPNYEPPPRDPEQERIDRDLHFVMQGYRIERQR